MAVIYGGSAKAFRMQAVADFAAGGTLELQTSADVVLAALPLSDPQSGPYTGGVWTMGLEPANAIVAGVAAKARVRKSGTTVISGFTVGLPGSGADIIMSNTNLAVDQPVSVISATITHAA